MCTTNQAGRGAVREIRISREKGQPREAVAEGFFAVEWGLEGDVHSGPGERQVLILGIEGRERLADSPQPGLCFRRFGETISTAGVDLFRLPKGARVRIGESIQEVSRTGKDCYPECGLVQAGQLCALSREVVFTRVLVSGRIRPGDPVEPLNPPEPA